MKIMLFLNSSVLDMISNDPLDKSAGRENEWELENQYGISMYIYIWSGMHTYSAEAPTNQEMIG